jgi:hypothetical protein
MSYEIFEKKATRIGAPAITISKDRISANSPAARIFHQQAVEFVLLLWDKTNRKLALRPLTKKDSRAYKLTYGQIKNNQPNGLTFSARSFLSHIGWDYAEKKVMPAAWNEEEGIMECEIPAECLADLRQGKLLSIGSPGIAR